jgi:Tetracyclin repressor-like, C-terminal domain
VFSGDAEDALALGMAGLDVVQCAPRLSKRVALLDHVGLHLLAREQRRDEPADDAELGHDVVLRYVDATLGCLTDAGFGYALADHAWTALDAYIYGFTIQKRNFPLEPTQYAAAAKGFLHLIPVETFPHLNGMSQEVIAGRHDGLHQLEFGLELLLTGLEAQRRANRA